MSKILIDEATVKLVLEALEYIYEGANNQGPHTGISWRCVSKKAAPVITALRKALAEPDFWAGYVPEPDNTCSNTLRIQGKAYPRTCKKCGLGPCVELAQQALNKMAENARELGLDYEPVCNKDPQGCWNVRCQLGKKCKNTPAQQEPVATITITQRGPIRIIDNNFDDCVRGWPDGEYKLYTSPPAQRTWVGLDDSDIGDEYVRFEIQGGFNRFEYAVRAIEAKLRSKNEDRN